MRTGLLVVGGVLLIGGVAYFLIKNGAGSPAVAPASNNGFLSFLGAATPGIASGLGSLFGSSGSSDGTAAYTTGTVEVGTSTSGYGLGSIDIGD